MEGSMFERKLNEMAVLYDYALENQWSFNEIYDNYPFPADLANTVSIQFRYWLDFNEHQENSPEPGSLAPKTISQRLKAFGLDNFKKLSKDDRVSYFRNWLETLHGL